MAGKISYNLVKGFMKLIFRIEVRGKENFPLDGGCMVCANHLSMWDPVLLMCFMPRMISFVAKEELKRVPYIGGVLKSVDTIFIKRNSSDLSAIKASMKAIEEGKVVGIFPTGTREKTNPDAKPKSGAALIASKTGAKVIPVGINATYKLFSRIVVTIGEPVDYAEYKGRKMNSEQLENMVCEIYDKIIENKSC
ncbi:MAG: 1-acyl-sn-glycerol-3-phosphate acyltransferase [Clostridia bacterium]|nr:1-acyl-sn-glycerol-3-phosphate acyltransferase [Clostridia bacterium]